ncbi:ferrochelatase [Aquitalea palustris]|uniref:Ferrochelatase n=1 Tax=Aquitalea palustris TaxID=2480983 RepID=A0A454JMP6_9NEIS|nr:ferrochelatase [Aquitalea palustris]RMD01391.1 ferrochelatase [Aquitalea palustris]
MSGYLPEPPFSHDSQAKTGILLINLGTPTAPTGQAVRPYLKQFLSDTRVIEIPKTVWWLILNGIILNVRPKKSAEKYASIWSKDGSPLLVNTRKQTSLLKGLLGERGMRNIVVDYAMRYGQPSVESVIQNMRAQGVDKLLVLPLYPQYAGSSSATALDDVFRVLMKLRNMPELRTVRHFHDDPGYVDALAQQVQAHWQQNGRAEKLLMSFHGVPRFTLDKGDPYHCECLKTGRLLAERLGLSKEQYVVSFQSRFGRAEWLQPYTSATLEQLGKAGTKSLDVICPGFVSDCLETLEEIAMEGKHSFQSSGGGEFRYISCLNDNPQWIAALAGIVGKNLQGWQEVIEQDTAQRQQRAQSLGAKS